MGALLLNTPEDAISLLEFYRRMALLRAFEEARLALARSGRLAGEQFLALGQEATAVGLTAALAPGDRLFPSRRGLALRVAAGLSPDEGLREAGRGGLGHSTPAGHLPIAVGAALAARLAGESRLSLAEFGDGAAEDGILLESLQLAVRWESPVLFACVNNGYAGTTPSPTRSGEAAIHAARGLGLPVARVDGQDGTAVLEATRALLDEIRSRRGPAFIECATYCVAPHVVAAGTSHSEERPSPELDFWRNRDPLRRFRSRLLQDELAREETLDVLAEAAAAEVAEAARRVYGAADPSASVALTRARPTDSGGDA